MLEIQNVTKSFGALEVLRGVDLTVEREDYASAVHELFGAGRERYDDL